MRKGFAVMRTFSIPRLLLPILVASSLFAAPANVQVDTKTHALSITDGSTVIDAKAITLTLGGFTISDASGVKTVVLGSVSGTKIGDTGNKIGFLGATPIVRPVGTTDLRIALINLGLYTTGGATPLSLNGGTFTAGSIVGTNETLSGTLGVTGNTTVGGTFSVTGGSTFHAITGTNETLSGTLGVTGATSLNAVTATTGGFSSNVTVSGSFTGAAVSSSEFTGPGDSITATIGSASRTILTKFRDLVSLKDYGAVGDGVTNNDAAFTAALASSYPVIYVPDGRYVTNLLDTQLVNKHFVGPGKIVSNIWIPGEFTWLTTPLAADENSSILMSGDLSKIDAERFGLNGKVRKSPTQPYYEYSTTPHVIEFENNSGGSGKLANLAAPASAGATSVTLTSVDGLAIADDLGFGYGNSATDIHAVSAINTSTKVVTLSTALTDSHLSGDPVLNAARTMNQAYFAALYQRAGGDAYIWGGRVFAGHEIPSGAANFEENSTAGIIGGDLNASANGVYFTPFEFQTHDNGFDVSVITVQSFDRTKGPANGGGLYGNTWIAYLISSQGAQPIDVGYGLTGPATIGLDFALANLGNGGCAVGLTDNQYIYFTNGSTNRSGIQLWGNVLGTTKLGYNSGTSAVEQTVGGNKTQSITATGVSVNGRAIFKGWLHASATINFGSIGAGGVVTATVSVPGAIDGDIVELGIPSAADPGFIYKAEVTVTDTVTIVARNVTTGTLVGTSGTFNLAIPKF